MQRYGMGSLLVFPHRDYYGHHNNYTSEKTSSYSQIHPRPTSTRPTKFHPKSEKKGNYSERYLPKKKKEGRKQRCIDMKMTMSYLGHQLSDLFQTQQEKSQGRLRFVVVFFFGPNCDGGRGWAGTERLLPPNCHEHHQTKYVSTDLYYYIIDPRGGGVNR